MQKCQVWSFARKKKEIDRFQSSLATQYRQSMRTNFTEKPRFKKIRWRAIKRDM